MTVAIVTPSSQFNTWLLLEFVACRENGVCAYCSVQLKSITLVQLFLTLALTMLCLCWRWIWEPSASQPSSLQTELFPTAAHHLYFLSSKIFKFRTCVLS